MDSLDTPDHVVVWMHLHLWPEFIHHWGQSVMHIFEIFRCISFLAEMTCESYRMYLYQPVTARAFSQAQSLPPTWCRLLSNRVISTSPLHLDVPLYKLSTRWKLCTGIVAVPVMACTMLLQDLALVMVVLIVIVVIVVEIVRDSFIEGHVYDLLTFSTTLHITQALYTFR